MKLFGWKVFVGKDGGKDSNVSGLFIENKKICTIALLRFTDGSREAFHSHAFNSLSLLLKGTLREQFVDLSWKYYLEPAVILTKRRDLHKVYSDGTSYVLTLRGPWVDRWYEVVDSKDSGAYLDTLVHGRKLCTFDWFRTREAAAASKNLRTSV